MKITKSITLGVVAILTLAPVSQSRAFTYSFQNFGGVQFGSTIVTGSTEFALGYFTGALSVNGALLDLSNFTNLNTDGSPSGVQWSSAIDFGDPASNLPTETFITVGTAPMDANTGGLKPAAGTLLYVVGRSTSGPSFSFAFGNPIWTVLANTPTDPGGAEYDWDNNLSTPKTEGFDFSKATFFTANASFSTATGANIVTVVPEPSTGALMMIGAVGLVALRRLRKV